MTNLGDSERLEGEADGDKQHQALRTSTIGKSTASSSTSRSEQRRVRVNGEKSTFRLIISLSLSPHINSTCCFRRAVACTKSFLIECR